MHKLFRKSRLMGFLALLSIAGTSSSLMAWDQCCNDSPSNRTYVGAFGGVLYSESSGISQMGTAFFTEAVGGPLAIDARGHSKSTSSGFGGVQVGYELSQCPWNIGCSGWSISPAFELEGLWYNSKKKGHLINDIERLGQHGLEEHDFADSFDVSSGVYLVNAVFALNIPCFSSFTPYVGGGIGATRISLTNASSIQVSPDEPGVNHFNSRRSDSAWAFAAQAKAGLRYNFCESFHIFGEYRYVFVDSSNYIFGSTVYDGHAATSPWNVKVNNINYNAFAFGIQYDL